MSAHGEVYEIRVRRHLDHHWATWSGCTDLVHHDDDTTTLRTGPVDQSQLHGILTRLRDMGVALTEVRSVGTLLGTEGSSMGAVVPHPA